MKRLHCSSVEIHKWEFNTSCVADHAGMPGLRPRLTVLWPSQKAARMSDLGQTAKNSRKALTSESPK
jgi:hypothetical protein